MYLSYRFLCHGGGNIQHPRLKPTYNNDVNNNIVPAPIYVDPLLGPLADNGGVNKTMAPLIGSPAIDQGVAGCPATDQRGAGRVDQCDIGAVEFGASTADPTAMPTPTVTATAQPGSTVTPTPTPTIVPTTPGNGGDHVRFVPLVRR